ncbi:MAG: hypothetical protein ACO32Z_05545 [Gemmatimonadaceae bacterium]
MRPPLLSLLLFGTASVVEAQVRPVSVAVPATAATPTAAASASVPVSMLPPAGRCRIWIDGVPASQQPAPTDCATALRQKPANGTILYGPSERDEAGERFERKAREHRAKESRPVASPPRAPASPSGAVPAASPVNPETRRPAAPSERKPREDRS